MCRSRIGRLAHNKSHSWWRDPSYRRLSRWMATTHQREAYVRRLHETLRRRQNLRCFCPTLPQFADTTFFSYGFPCSVYSCIFNSAPVVDYTLRATHKTLYTTNTVYKNNEKIQTNIRQNNITRTKLNIVQSSEISSHIVVEDLENK